MPEGRIRGPSFEFLDKEPNAVLLFDGVEVPRCGTTRTIICAQPNGMGKPHECAGGGRDLRDRRCMEEPVPTGGRGGGVPGSFG